MNRSLRHLFVPSAVAALALLLSGCGDDDSAESTAPTTESTPPTTGDVGSSAPDVLEVRAIDYGYEGLPQTIAVGTKLSLVNLSDAELHEVIAIRLPDDETRSVEELLALPEEELEALFAAGEPDGLAALPGETDNPGLFFGDGVLDQPGRYAFICFIPTGADPQAVLEALQNDEEPGEDAGPPHFTQGMFAEVTVG